MSGKDARGSAQQGSSPSIPRLTTAFFRENGIPPNCPEEMLQAQVNILHGQHFLFVLSQISTMTYDQLRSLQPAVSIGIINALKPFCAQAHRDAPSPPGRLPREFCAQVYREEQPPPTRLPTSTFGPILTRILPRTSTTDPRSNPAFAFPGLDHARQRFFPPRPHTRIGFIPHSAHDTRH
jgi:hypothetical protein